MIAYLDTSAFVPLVVEQPTSPVCERIWTDSPVLVSSVMLTAECMAALSMARRMGRLGPRGLRTAVANAEELLGQVALVTATPSIAAQAGSLALDQGLRAYDAVHLATALTLRDDASSAEGADELALVSGDQDLLTAANAVGLTVVRTSAGG